VVARAARAAARQTMVGERWVDELVLGREV